LKILAVRRLNTTAGCITEAIPEGYFKTTKTSKFF
jgi:hypothetical protein